ncbi:MAG: UvrB/UvrC motif-containing protein [Lachnospiraceae bacterium]|nr:UvrB/UvrC motif-containing protein [Lachnospiraceae bacterium]
MLCEQCKKREATVKYVEVANGVKTEHNLCGVCASQLDIGPFSAMFEGEISLASLLSGLLGIQGTERNDGRFAEVVCPNCGTTYKDFVETSRFGCSDCYGVFGPLLGENIRHLQGSERHVGKRPDYVLRDEAAKAQVDEEADKNSEDASGRSTELPKLTKEEQTRLLQTRIKDALRREDYEEAAALRDRIRSLKEENE